MTADDARKLARASVPDITEKVKLLLEKWHELIRKAASASPSRNKVSQSQLPRVRTSIPLAAYIEARRKLQDDGFQVRWVRATEAFEDYEVSW